MPTTLVEIFRDSETHHRLSLFDQPVLKAIEAGLFEKNGKPHLNCLASDKDRPAKPEEIIRQLWLHKLINEYGYPKARIQVEYAVSQGLEKKRADIVVFDKERLTVPYIIVELKKPKLKDGKDQLKSYCNWTGAPVGVWSNGEQYSFYNRKDPNYFNDLTDLPNANQTLTEVINEKFTLDDLIKRDKLVTERKSLKDLILEMEDEVLANAGVDVFEELFKLIFTKLYDEMTSGQNRKRPLEFRNTGTEGELKQRIQALFEKAKAKWEGVFPEDDKIKLTPSHLSVCVASLENVKLFNSNLDVVDEAFEYLVGKSSKGEKGQYFTPRYVIDMCVKMMNPNREEFIIDTASGSAGFPVHSIFKVWRDIFREEKIPESDLFTLEKKPQPCYDYVGEKVFAIDFDEKVVRVARCLNLIAGDGQTNVLHLNTLDYDRWDETTKSEDWNDTYNEGFKRLKKLRKDKTSWKEFEFDVLMANPPFAGDIKETRIIAKYELGKKTSGKYETAVGRDLLFIERNLDFLKPGGRMAVVLPQGRFNNASDKALRDYIGERCRILAVVGLHGNTFKPHTGTKTSVLFVQKWTDEQKAKREAIRNKHLAEFKKHFAELEEAVKMHRSTVPELGRAILAEELGGDKDDEELAKEKKSFGKCLSEIREDKLESDAKKLETEDIGKSYADKSRYALESKALKMRQELARRNDRWALWYLVEYMSRVYEKQWLAKKAVGTELDYAIFFATQRKPGKDTSGDKIFVKRPAPPKSETKSITATQEAMPLQEVPDTYNAEPPSGDFLLDLHGHLIVEHDLFNHDGLTRDGIAEAFQEFAKKEKLSFALAGKQADKEQFKHLETQILVSPLSSLPESHRLDAEFFQPRIQHLFQVLSRSGKKLGDVARLREKRFEPKQGEPFHYIEIGNLSSDGGVNSEVVMGEEAPSRATWIVQPGDVITSTVRPNRCLTGLIEPEQAGNICSSGFAVLTPKGIPGELLFAYLRLPVICELMDLHTTASMYPAISTTDLMRLPFLLPDDATIKKVKQQITAARTARREAHELLEKAKQAVEVAIEKNEAAGMAMLVD